MDLVAQLAAAGFVAPVEEAAELRAAAGDDAARLDAMLARRLTGEPLAWITGTTEFCGLTIRVDPGVYVPRLQTEWLAQRAAERLPARGTAVDLCTGSGAVAAVLAARRPSARVLATELDPRAVACARSNGVETFHGDFFASRPGPLDVVVGVLPYVPTGELRLLQRDTLAFESTLSYDGGPDGLALIRRAVSGAAERLRPGGALLLELGGDQAEALRPDLARHGFTDVVVHADEDGDPRGVEATRS